MRLDRIYTRSGDDGRTSLGDGKRVPKFDPRVAAYGSIDEANATIGIAILHVEQSDIREVLTRIQNDLFDIGADLCMPERQGEERDVLRTSPRQVVWIEDLIDRFNSSLSPLDSFVLPGGSIASAHLHHARTVTRRAERCIASLAAHEKLGSAILEYVNRLSDLLFVLSRYVNEKGKRDVLWRPGGNQTV